MSARVILGGLLFLAVADLLVLLIGATGRPAVIQSTVAAPTLFTPPPFPAATVVLIPDSSPQGVQVGPAGVQQDERARVSHKDAIGTHPLVLVPEPQALTEPVDLVTAIAEPVVLPPPPVVAVAIEGPRPLGAFHGHPDHAALDRLCGPTAPLLAYEAHMAQAADARGLDGRLLWVVALAESGCGNKACGGNAWGLGNCDGRNASDFDAGIEEAADALAGWVDKLGLERALCVWQSGDPTCTKASGAGYRDRALARMEALMR